MNKPIYLFLLATLLPTYGKAESPIERKPTHPSLMEDWEAQRGEKSYSDVAGQEIHRILRILDRQKDHAHFESQKNYFEKLLANAPSLNSKELYYGLRQLKRELLLADKAIDFTEILCIDNPLPHGPEPTHEARARTENTATFGGRLIVIEGFDPDSPTRQLAPGKESKAAFWRPDLCYEGKNVLFSMRDAQEKTYHLYEIGIDGSNFRELTSSDYNDLDPIYAPDGSIIFSTTRCNHGLRCGGPSYRMCTLARCDKDGKNIYFISANVDADYTPVFLPDGRILYTRWEYIDKSVFRIQSLWTVNPDGTNVNTYWGNQSTWPDMLLNARPIPGSNKIVFTGSGHHDIFGGPVGIVDVTEGMNYPDGIWNMTYNVPWAEVGKGPEDQLYRPDWAAPECYKAFQTPYPLNENYFLVSARKGNDYHTLGNHGPIQFSLYLLDIDGNMELLHVGENNIFYGTPIKSRPKPKLLPSSVEWAGRMTKENAEAEWGTLYSSDVYENSGIPQGLVKSLRILEVEPQTYSDGVKDQFLEKSDFLKRKAIPNYHGYGETVVSLMMDDATKRVWGTVPVEEDGSVHFKVPPVKGLYFQLLDEKGRALQTMRSSTHVMPGETRGCNGCHATQNRPPKDMKGLAMKRPPSEIKKPSWGEATIGFDRFVQPVLDKHCISCHGGDKPKGELDLRRIEAAHTPITWSYVNLVFGKNPKDVNEWKEKSIAGPIIPYYVYPNKEVKYPTNETVIPPMTAMSYKSKLIEIATSGKHHNVKVSPVEEEQLVAWVDALCPFLGLEEVLNVPDISPEDYEEASNYHPGLAYPSRMRTAPFVHKAFMQDDFKTQDDRIPRDKDGNFLPSLRWENGIRKYYIPETNDQAAR